MGLGFHHLLGRDRSPRTRSLQRRRTGWGDIWGFWRKTGNRCPEWGKRQKRNGRYKTHPDTMSDVLWRMYVQRSIPAVMFFFGNAESATPKVTIVENKCFDDEIKPKKLTFRGKYTNRK
ncbi:hypothetical protein CDAR_451921 [Caerostris darwini]|uniref:Uncharacterized protein n=1 Tax=Caerostris darwini TaxID=1538125 RepID=A0AAV4SV24_9ARAC|nr:hypothetical protein CDAR_451921 [Caerostris darwini]